MRVGSRGPALAVFAALGSASCVPKEVSHRLPLRATLEDRTDSGELYTPGTQSLLRTRHWMESVSEVELGLRGDRATFRFGSPDAAAELILRNVPMMFLVPALYYAPAEPPDAFDAYNLMLAEYSRNGIALAYGRKADTMHHFETNLSETVPWKLTGDYQFAANSFYKPLRVGVINNCLRPGLFEISAADPSGEIYHGWFDMPLDAYFDWVARKNGVTRAFAQDATVWRDEEVALKLDRLRDVTAELGETPVRVADEGVSYSTQDSRRKLSKKYVVLDTPEGQKVVSKLSDFADFPVKMSEFVEPGKYSITNRKSFSFAFLFQPTGARVRTVKPKTIYAIDAKGLKAGQDSVAKRYVEIELDLGEEKLLLGNLPLHLLVERDDFAIEGFGVGVLSSSTFAERRDFLFSSGPRPSFAYLAKVVDGKLVGRNSHDRGIEQIFIRSHPKGDHVGDTPYWELIVTSYERIVDIVRYRVDIPEALREEQLANNVQYVPPLCFSYRDDNVR